MWFHMMLLNGMYHSTVTRFFPGDELLVRRSVRRWGVCLVWYMFFYPSCLTQLVGTIPRLEASDLTIPSFEAPRNAPPRCNWHWEWLGRTDFVDYLFNFFVKRSMLWNVKTDFCFSFCNLDVNQHWIFQILQWFSGRLFHFDWLLRLSKIQLAKFCRDMQSRGFSVDSHPPNGYCVDGQFIWLC